MALSDIAVGALVFSVVCGALRLVIPAPKSHAEPGLDPALPAPVLIEGWNQVYEHHRLDGEGPDRAVARTERWVAHDLRGVHYDVSCDQRLDAEVRERLGTMLACERRMSSL